MGHRKLQLVEFNELVYSDNITGIPKQVEHLYERNRKDQN